MAFEEDKVFVAIEGLGSVKRGSSIERSGRSKLVESLPPKVSRAETREKTEY